VNVTEEESDNALLGIEQESLEDIVRSVLETQVSK
jgi:hypothetical protein